MEGTAEPMASSSTAASALSWVLDNKLKAIFYTWGSGVTGSLVSKRVHGDRASPGAACSLLLACAQVYQWTRPIPTSLKIIHSRVYAQVRGACLCHSVPPNRVPSRRP